MAGPEMFAFLLERISLSSRDSMSKEVIKSCILWDDLRMMEVYLAHITEYAVPWVVADALMMATEDCYTPLMEFALRRGADPLCYPGLRYFPLARAVENNCLDGVRLLLEYGADPHSEAMTGVTALERVEYFIMVSDSPAQAAEYRAMADLMRQYLDEDDDR